MAIPMSTCRSLCAKSAHFGPGPCNTQLSVYLFGTLGLRHAKRIKGAEPKAEVLFTTCHGVGATFIGSLLAMAIFFVAYLLHEAGKLTSCSFWVVSLPIVSLPIIAVIFHYFAYYRVAGIAKGFFGLILIDDLTRTREAAKNAIRKLANEKWRNDGSKSGDDLTYWLQAEARTTPGSREGEARGTRLPRYLY